MRKTFMWALPLLIALMSGCVTLSLHPLYTADDNVFQPELLGRWTEKDDDETWEFTKSGERQYEVVLTEKDGKRGVFEGHLVKLGGALFLDLRASPMEGDMSTTWTGHLVPAHSFVRVQRLTPTPVLAPVNYKWMESLLDKSPTALRHEMVQDGSDKQVVLTASTRELQAFFAKHAANPEAFGNSLELVPKK